MKVTIVHYDNQPSTLRLDTESELDRTMIKVLSDTMLIQGNVLRIKSLSNIGYDNASIELDIIQDIKDATKAGGG